MKSLDRLVLGITLVLVFLAGYGFRSVLAQQNSGAGQSAEKLPPDIHPETLSRATRVKREDLTTDEQRQAFDHVMVLSPKQKVSRWLGATGIRLQIPELAEIWHEQINMIHEKGGLEPKYQEFAIVVAARETNNKSAFVGHGSAAVRLGIDPKAVEIVRTRQDTKGLDEKEAAIIQFGRELFEQPIMSSKTFVEAERNLGRKGTLGMTLFMAYYMTDAMVEHAYDQHLETGSGCVDQPQYCAKVKGVPW